MNRSQWKRAPRARALQRPQRRGRQCCGLRRARHPAAGNRPLRNPSRDCAAQPTVEEQHQLMQPHFQIRVAVQARASAVEPAGVAVDVLRRVLRECLAAAPIALAALVMPPMQVLAVALASVAAAPVRAPKQERWGSASRCVGKRQGNIHAVRHASTKCAFAASAQHSSTQACHTGEWHHRSSPSGDYCLQPTPQPHRSSCQRPSHAIAALTNDKSSGVNTTLSIRACCITTHCPRARQVAGSQHTQR